MGRSNHSESKNNRNQRIRSIAIAFLHFPIFPRRLNQDVASVALSGSEATIAL